MARRTPQRPRPAQPARTPSAPAPTPAARAPRAPRPASGPSVTTADYEADLAARYHHVRRDLVRIVVIGVVLFGLILAAKAYVDQTGSQLFFNF